MADQARDMAHLRDLPRCGTCGRAATQQLYNGVNAPLGVYCASHGKAALRRLKAGER